MIHEALEIIGSLEPIQIYKGMCPCILPKKDHYSNWVCLDCGARGKVKVRYKSTLKTRVRAHFKCRCKGWAWIDTKNIFFKRRTEFTGQIRQGLYVMIAIWFRFGQTWEAIATVIFVPVAGAGDWKNGYLISLKRRSSKGQWATQITTKGFLNYKRRGFEDEYRN